MTTEAFNQAVAVVNNKENNYSKEPSKEVQLSIYAHFKQANVGDCNTSAPSMINVKEKAKWSAWNDLKGMTKDDAIAKYIDIVEKEIKPLLK